VVVNLGDAACMPSLSSYDKGKRSFQGRSYAKDIEAHLDFQERMWGPVRARKKRLPYRVVLEGNHEHRVERALDMSPELEGTIGFSDFQFNEYYDTVIRYNGNGPGIIDIDGVQYAHYFVSGVMGRPIGGERHAASLLAKRYQSSTCAHSHLLDFACRTNGNGNRLFGISAGCFIDYQANWPGHSQDLWWRGVVIKRNVSENGGYDPEFVSMDQLKKIYA
jgi:hypothetical protein